MRRERFKRLFTFLSAALVIGLQTAVFAYIWYHYYNSKRIMRVVYWRRGNWALIALFALIVFLLSKLFGALKVGYMRVLDVIVAQILSVLCSSIITYIQLALIGRWKFLTHMQPILGMTGVNLLIVTGWVFLMRWLYIVIYPPKSTILVYENDDKDKLLKDMASRRDKYDLGEVVHLDEGIDYIKERILLYDSVLIGDMPSHERNLLVKYCFEKNIRCYCSQKITDIMIMNAERIHMFDTPLLLFRNRGLTVEQQTVKRIMDIIFSGLFLLVLSPLLLLIALLIKLYDGGPVFYCQNRLTIDGRIFRIMKFRSMRVDSEKSGARLAMKNDDRITPIGRVLRQIHFDELPQLINILKGEMSLVGPRPERPEIAMQYLEDIPEFDYRLKVKAGLTGYAQVYGKYNTTPYDKLKLDLMYIENYSVLLDLQLIAMTVKVLFQKENTEGVEQWQVTAKRKAKGRADRENASHQKTKQD